MKKLVATAAVAAMLGSAAFADVNVGLNGQNVWAIGNSTDTGNDNSSEVMMSNATPWHGDGTRNQISVEASNENFGGKFAYNHNGDSNTGIDCGWLWYSPVEQFKIWAGKGTGDNIRGDACYSTWDLFRVGTMDNGDNRHEAFTFQGQDSTGAKIGVFPIEGLQIYASLNYPCWNNKDADAGDIGDSENKLTNILGRQSKYALAYAIGGDEGIATVKLGLDTTAGRVVVKDGDGSAIKDQNILNVAADIKPMDNLFISLGAFIPTVQKYYAAADADKWAAVESAEDLASMFTALDAAGVLFVDGEPVEKSAGNKVNLYARYGATDELTIHAQVGTKIGTYLIDKDGKNKKDGQFGIFVAGGVDYKVMEDVKVFADVGYANGIYLSNKNADNTDCMNFGIGVQKDYEGCSVSAGFVGATNGYGMYQTTYTDNGDTKYPFSWGIPLRVSYSF